MFLSFTKKKKIDVIVNTDLNEICTSVYSVKCRLNNVNCRLYTWKTLSINSQCYLPGYLFVHLNMLAGKKFRKHNPKLFA